jgi:GNAT superfamily N-acetyltransferase
MMFALDLASEQRFWKSEMSEPRFTSWTGTLSVVEDETHGCNEAAHGFFVLYRDARFDGNFWDSMDADSADLELIASAISGPGGSADDDLFDDSTLFGGDVLIADRIWVHPEFRGHGYSHVLVDQVARTLAPEGVIALLPMPPGDQTAGPVAALQRHWAAGGFGEWERGVFVRSSRPAGRDD